MEPGVSFVVCTRNRHVQLAACLAAFSRLPGAPAWELILVDNGSSPPVADMPEVRAFGGHLCCVTEMQPGLGAARDTGWRVARFPIVAFTDDDCYVAADYVARLLEVYRSHPTIDYVGGRITLFDASDLPVTIDQRTEPVCYPARRFIRPGALQGANLTVRRDILAAVGGVDRRLGAGTRFPCEDLELVARLSWRGHRGMFHPGPWVAHHHGRKRRGDMRALRAGYDRGRGAYYALFLMCRRSRWSTLGNWLLLAARDGCLLRFGKIGRELRSALQFYRFARR